MDQYIAGNLLMGKEMVMVFLFGQMVKDMKVNLKMALEMVRELIFIIMGLNILVYFLKVMLMERVLYTIKIIKLLSRVYSKTTN